MTVQWGTVKRDPAWSERPVYIVGGGPSLAGRDLSRLPGLGFVVGVNRAGDFVEVSATFSIDMRWVQAKRETLAEWAKRHEVCVAAPADHDRAPVPGVTYLQRVEDGRHCSNDQGKIRNGRNSGHGAIQYAILKGGRDIILLGFDLVKVAKDEPTHWHDGYPWESSRGSQVLYPSWWHYLEQLASDLPPGVTVRNANPESAVKAFPFTTYEAVGL